MNAILPDADWTIGTMQEGDDNRTRCVVMSLLDLEIGITGEGEWVCRDQEKLVPLAATADPSRFFQFFDRSQMEFQGMLRAGLVSLGMPMELADNFPCGALVAGAINSHDPLWSSRALNWLEQGVPMTLEIAQALEEFITHKRGIQRDRHRASQLLKLWE